MGGGQEELFLVTQGCTASPWMVQHLSERHWGILLNSKLSICMACDVSDRRKEGRELSAIEESYVPATFVLTIFCVGLF